MSDPHWSTQFFQQTTGYHTTHHIDLNLLYLEAQNNGPYQAKNKTRVSIDNVFCTDTFQSNLNKGKATVSENCMTWTTLDYVFLYLLLLSTTVTRNETRVHVAQFIYKSIWSTHILVVHRTVDNVLSEPILPTEHTSLWVSPPAWALHSLQASHQHRNLRADLQQGVNV